MNFLNISSLILATVLVIYFLILAYMLIRGIRERKQEIFYFSFYILSVFLWGMFCLLFFQTKSNELANFFARATFVSSALIPISFLLFCLVYTGLRKKILLIISALFFSFFSLDILLIFFSNYIIQGVDLGGVINSGVYGGFHSLFILQIFLCMLFGIFLLLLNYKKASKIKKAQLKYFLTGIALSLFFGILLNSVIPVLVENSKSSFYGPISSVFMVGFIFYAVTRYRFMDIKLVFKKSFVYSLALILLLSVVIFLSILIQFVLQNYFSLDSYIAAVVVITLIVLFLPKVKKKFEDKFNSVFKKDYIDLSKKFDELEKYKFVTNYRIENFCRELLEEVKRIFNLVHVEFFVLDNNDAFVKAFPKENLETIKKDSDLINVLIKRNEVLIKEELRYLESGEGDLLIELMDKKSLEFIIPIKFRGKLVGFIGGGCKFSRECFSEEDIKFFEYIQKRTGIILGYLRQSNFLK